MGCLEFPGPGHEHHLCGLCSCWSNRHPERASYERVSTHSSFFGIRHQHQLRSAFTSGLKVPFFLLSQMDWRNGPKATKHHRKSGVCAPLSYIRTVFVSCLVRSDQLEEASTSCDQGLVPQQDLTEAATAWHRSRINMLWYSFWRDKWQTVKLSSDTIRQILNQNKHHDSWEICHLSGLHQWFVPFLTSAL